MNPTATVTDPAAPAEAAGARVVVDLSAFSHNLRVLRGVAGDAIPMAIVKANAYGHGNTGMAEAAVRAGMPWLGIAQVGEALHVRRALAAQGLGADTRILTWILQDGALAADAIREGLDLSVSRPQMLAVITAAAREVGAPARLHIKVDTGMSRGGATLEDLPALAAAVRMAIDEGVVELVGLWSHFARADDPSDEGNAATARQLEEFRQAERIVADAGLEVRIRHMGATAATVWHPEAHLDMVRLGIGMYGLSPDHTVATAAELGLRPAMRLEVPLQSVKVIDAGRPVSYGGTWVAPTRRWVGLVPIGYGEGIMRAASNRGPVTVMSDGGPLMTHVIGRVCMDQFIIDLGEAAADARTSSADAPARAGDTVVLWGDPSVDRVPSAEDWADACGTISYEVVTRLTERLPRVYIGEVSDGAAE